MYNADEFPDMRDRMAILILGEMGIDEIGVDDVEDYALDAYVFADALLKARQFRRQAPQVDDDEADLFCGPFKDEEVPKVKAIFNAEDFEVQDFLRDWQDRG